MHQRSAGQQSARGRKPSHGTPVVECFFCKKSGHTFEKCKAMLASQRLYTEAQSQRRKSTGPSQSLARLAISDSEPTNLHDRQLFDEFVAFKAFPSSTQPPDAYSAAQNSNPRAFMASAKVNYDCTDLSPVTNHSGRIPDHFIIAASPATVLLPSEIIVQPDSQANVNICGFHHFLHEFKEGSTDITGIANAKSSGQGVIMFFVKTTANTTVTAFRLKCLYTHGRF